MSTKPLGLLSEQEFLEAVLDLAKVFSWKSAHFRPARTKYGYRTAVSGDGKGFPDLVLVKNRRIIFAELKSQKGKMSPEQDKWMTALYRIPGVEVYLWRPADLPIIADVLQLVPSK